MKLKEMKRQTDSDARLYLWGHGHEYEDLSDKDMKKVKKYLEWVMFTSYLRGYMSACFWWRVYYILTGFDGEQALQKMNEKRDEKFKK